MIRAFIRYLVCIVFLAPAAAFAQSPNTATLVVTVARRVGAIIKNAAVSVVNSDTGATREAVSGDDGTTTVPALAADGHLRGHRDEAGIQAGDDQGLDAASG